VEGKRRRRGMERGRVVGGRRERGQEGKENGREGKEGKKGRNKNLGRETAPSNTKSWLRPCGEGIEGGKGGGQKGDGTKGGTGGGNWVGQ
jgi:hypothetical protein